MNILKNTKCYLIGPIESATDLGTKWRRWFKTELKELDIVSFDPCDKPFVKDLSETEEMQVVLKKLRKEKRFEELEKLIKTIRTYDLNLVDRADFVVFNYDPTVKTCGSWEEFFWANRLKKPIFFVCHEESQIPLWVYGTLSHKYFYKTLGNVLDMLYKIDSGTKEIDSNRWRLLREEYR